MHRRAPIRPVRALAAGVALLGLVLTTTSCSVARPPAATVDGQEISAERIDALVEAFLAGDPETYGPVVEGEGEGTYQTAAVADILGTIVLQTIQAELADREDAIPTPEERSEAEDLVRNSFHTGASAQPDPSTGEVSPEAAEAQDASAAAFDSLDEDTQEWLVDLRAKTLALARVVSEDADTTELARQIYEADPSAFDALCIRAIIVPTDQLPAVQDRLAAGEDFGQVSAEVTTDQPIAEAEGSLGECLPATQLAQFLPQEVIDLVTPLQVGEVSEPFELPPAEGQTEELVAIFDLSDRQPAAFEDVEADISATLPDPGDAALAELVADSIAEFDVEVEPRFGSWHVGQETCTELQPNRNPTPACLVPPKGARTPEGSEPLIDAGTGG